MPENILTNGTSAADSTDQIIPAGTTVGLKSGDMVGSNIPDDAEVIVYIKDDLGQYIEVDRMNSGKAQIVILGPGVFRFSRVAGGNCGVFRG